MEIKITGTVEQIQETQTFPSGFCKRILVIKTEDKYPQTIPVEFVKEKCEMLDSLTLDQPVTAYVNLRGNEWNGKYFAAIQGWKLETGEQAAPSKHEEAKANAYQPEPEQDVIPF